MPENPKLFVFEDTNPALLATDITLRDLFAGLIAANLPEPRDWYSIAEEDDPDGYRLKAWARGCYRRADALLAAREESK